MDNEKRSDHKLDNKKVDSVKDSLENLSLYLNEIEKIINAETTPEVHSDQQYKLYVLEQYLADMNEVFLNINNGGKTPSNKIC